MKRIKLILIFSCLISIVYGQDLKWIHFDWDGDSIGGKYFDKNAILVPITIDDLPYKFNAQLDLGAGITMVYGNTFAPVLEKHPEIKNKIDTLGYSWIESTKNPHITNVSLKIDNVSFGKRTIALFKNYGDSLTVDSLESKTVKHIGTIGPDLFQNKVLILDYKKNRMAVADSMPKQYAHANFQPMKIDDGRIKIPFSIADTTYDVMFDTGSSMFELVTDEENLKHCITLNSSIIDSLEIYAWGKKYYVYGRKINNLKIGGKLFTNAKVYEHTGDDWIRFHKEEKIIGETGNALFLNSILIIDYKNHRFGIL